MLAVGSEAVAVRIKGIIEPDGVIRIDCGGDKLEIEPVFGGLGTLPISVPREGLSPNAGDIPILSITAPRQTGAKGRIDVDEVVRRVSDELAAAGMGSGPTRLVLSQSAIDLHDVARLGRALQPMHPDIELAVHFGVSDD